jgi:hypothetical protein
LGHPALGRSSPKTPRRLRSTSALGRVGNICLPSGPHCLPTGSALMRALDRGLPNHGQDRSQLTHICTATCATSAPRPVPHLHRDLCQICTATCATSAQDSQTAARRRNRSVEFAECLLHSRPQLQPSHATLQRCRSRSNATETEHADRSTPNGARRTEHAERSTPTSGGRVRSGFGCCRLRTNHGHTRTRARTHAHKHSPTTTRAHTRTHTASHAQSHVYIY